MTSCLTQLKTAYETQNMSPEEIAEDQGLELVAVKAGLMQASSKYRKDCGHEEEANDGLNFSNDQLRAVNHRIFEIALGSENDMVALRACEYIRDDKKGRKEVVKAVQNNSFNILQFNESIQSARKLADKAKEAITI